MGLLRDPLELAVLEITQYHLILPQEGVEMKTALQRLRKASFDQIELLAPGTLQRIGALYKLKDLHAPSTRKVAPKLVTCWTAPA